MATKLYTREPGFYWVKFGDNETDWQPAKWTGRKWWVTALPDGLSDQMFTEIGDIITRQSNGEALFEAWSVGWQDGHEGESYPTISKKRRSEYCGIAK